MAAWLFLWFTITTPPLHAHTFPETPDDDEKKAERKVDDTDEKVTKPIRECMSGAKLMIRDVQAAYDDVEANNREKKLGIVVFRGVPWVLDAVVTKSES